MISTIIVAAAISLKSIAFLLAGILALWFAADWLVQGASKIAVNLKIKPMVVGLTIVAFGTSAPELLVSVSAALRDQPGVAWGNIVGSNVANIALVLGVCAFLSPIEIDRKTLTSELPMMLAATVLCYICAFIGTGLVLVDGIIFILFLAYFIYRAFSGAKDGDELDEETAELVRGSKKGMNAWYIFQIVVGFGGLVLGAKWLVLGATDIATAFGLSQVFIGLSIVAFGTSLPELAASGMAAWRGKTELSIGNVVGSNIFNIVLVLGVTSIIAPIQLTKADLSNELLWMLAVSFFLYGLCWFGKKLTKRHGTILLMTYVAFIYFTYKG